MALAQGDLGTDHFQGSKQVCKGSDWSGAKVDRESNTAG